MADDNENNKTGTHWCETMSRFFDLVFAVGFGFLAVFFILSPDTDTNGLFGVVMIAYYIFFTGFMTLSFLQVKWLMMYCGFLKGLFTKAMFYAFLTSMAFSRITEWYAIMVGGIDSVMTVVQFLRACGGFKNKAK